MKQYRAAVAERGGWMNFWLVFITFAANMLDVSAISVCQVPAIFNIFFRLEPRLQTILYLTVTGDAWLHPEQHCIVRADRDEPLNKLARWKIPLHVFRKASVASVAMSHSRLCLREAKPSLQFTLPCSGEPSRSTSPLSRRSLTFAVLAPSFNVQTFSRQFAYRRRSTVGSVGEGHTHPGIRKDPATTIFPLRTRPSLFERVHLCRAQPP